MKDLSRLEKLHLLLCDIAYGMDLTLKQVRSPLRKKENVACRQIFCLQAENEGLNNNPEVTAKIINRDRASVYHSIKVGNQRKEYDPYFKSIINKLIENGFIKKIRHGK